MQPHLTQPLPLEADPVLVPGRQQVTGAQRNQRHRRPLGTRAVGRCPTRDPPVELAGVRGDRGVQTELTAAGLDHGRDALYPPQRGPQRALGGGLGHVGAQLSRHRGARLRPAQGEVGDQPLTAGGELQLALPPPQPEAAEQLQPETARGGPAVRRVDEAALCRHWIGSDGICSDTLHRIPRPADGFAAVFYAPAAVSGSQPVTVADTPTRRNSAPTVGSLGADPFRSAVVGFLEDSARP
jgi:hypothetical protein